MKQHLRIEVEVEDDGRFIADIPQVPGAMAYGSTPLRAIAAALRVANSVTRYKAIG